MNLISLDELDAAEEPMSMRHTRRYNQPPDTWLPTPRTFWQRLWDCLMRRSRQPVI